PDRISLAETAVKAALRLRPDSAEAHFARADYLFRCLRDYDRAMEELAIARPGLPNSTPFFILSGYINRRRNHFHEAERDFSTAFALDPRNPNAYNLLAEDRKSTRLNSSHQIISYAVICLKKKNI